MGLQRKAQARRWDTFLMRLGCLMVAASMAASLVIQPPKAKAFASTAALSGMMGAYMSASGWQFQTNMNQSGFAESMARDMQKWLDERKEGLVAFGTTVGEYFDGMMEKVKVTAAGVMELPKEMVREFNDFAQWFSEKYGITDNSSVTVAGVDAEGGLFFTGENYSFLLDYPNFMTLKVTTSLNPGAWSTYTFAIPDVLTKPGYYKFLRIDDFSSIPQANIFCLSKVEVYCMANDRLNLSPVKISEDGVTLERFSIGQDKIDNHYTGLRITFSFRGAKEEYIPGERFPISAAYSRFYYGGTTIQNSIQITTGEVHYPAAETMTEQQAYAVAVPGVPALDIDGIIQGILAGIVQGNLEATGEIVEAGEAVKPEEPPVDPPLPVLPDVGDLGLDELGHALVTRFPFSIPWDVKNGVELLAAPARAPRFEVDFLAPMAPLVGGWKGSTAIVLDFAEYEIIGQVCRWTSTIGFCLFLASATKRLIWTA